MRLQLLYALFILSLASCSSYHYITLDSADVVGNERKAFLCETDTMRVTYQFSGEGGLMTISIFNKTNQPLYVNWKKSAVINSGKMVSLFNRKVIVTGIAETNTYQVKKNQNAGFSYFSASFDLPEGIDFLPPQSGLSKSVVNLQEISLNNTAIHSSVGQERIKTTEGIVTKFRRVYYTDEESPLRFKTYITLALGQNANNEFSVQHSFYAKEVVQSTEEPDLFSMYRANGSQFYIRRDVQ